MSIMEIVPDFPINSKDPSVLNKTPRRLSLFLIISKVGLELMYLRCIRNSIPLLRAIPYKCGHLNVGYACSKLGLNDIENPRANN